MTPSEAHELFLHNQWANRRSLGACEALTPEQFTRDLGSSFPSVRDTLGHIAGAEWIWLERFHGRSHMALPPGSDLPDLAAMRARLEDLDSSLVKFVSGLDAAALERVIEYKHFAGEQFAYPLTPLLQHLADHSTYHRGQVATLLRQLGAKPAATGFIAFHHERAVSLKTQGRAGR
jgi:uncharacterized damage-inducible protein DinB